MSDQDLKGDFAKIRSFVEYKQDEAIISAEMPIDQEKTSPIYQ